MAGYRLTHVAQSDILEILAWSEAQFGEEARKRHETLIASAIRDAASSTSDVGHTTRPELGEGVFSWHLAQSRAKASGLTVRRPDTSSSVVAKVTCWSSAEFFTTPWIPADMSNPSRLGISRSGKPSISEAAPRRGAPTGTAVASVA